MAFTEAHSGIVMPLTPAMQRSHLVCVCCGELGHDPGSRKCVRKGEDGRMHDPESGAETGSADDGSGPDASGDGAAGKSGQKIARKKTQRKASVVPPELEKDWQGLAAEERAAKEAAWRKEQAAKEKKEAIRQRKLARKASLRMGDAPGVHGRKEATGRRVRFFQANRPRVGSASARQASNRKASLSKFSPRKGTLGSVRQLHGLTDEDLLGGAFGSDEEDQFSDPEFFVSGARKKTVSRLAGMSAVEVRKMRKRCGAGHMAKAAALAKKKHHSHLYMTSDDYDREANKNSRRMRRVSRDVDEQTEMGARLLEELAHAHRRRRLTRKHRAKLAHRAMTPRSRTRNSHMLTRRVYRYRL